MDESVAFRAVSLRDYMKIFFRHKIAVLVTFSTILAAMAAVAVLMTAKYEATVTLLITAQRKIEAPYYQDAGYVVSSGESILALTQSEIITSTPVLERAVKVLKLYERPADYEKQFASELKCRVIDFQTQLKEFLKKIKKKKKKIGAGTGDPRQYAIRLAVADLRESMEAAPVKNTNLLSITVTDFDPEVVTKIANVVSRSYIIYDLEQQLAEYQLKYGQTHQIVQQLSADVDALIRRLLDEPRTNIEAIGPASVKIISPATVPLEPAKVISGQIGLVALLVVAAAAFASIALALVFEYFDQTFRSPQEAAAWLKLPLLGFLPHVNIFTPKIIDRVAADNYYTRAYHKLSDQIYLLAKNKNAKSLLLVSTLPNEGADVIVANLGKFIASKFSCQTLIIDANFRKPTLYRHFKIHPIAGLAEILEGKETLKNTVKRLGTNLELLCTGNSPNHPLSLLSSAQMADVIEQAKREYDIVLINGTHMTGYKDTELIALHVDGALYVVAEGKTRRQVVKHAFDSCGGQNLKWLGLIVNNRRFVIPKLLYKRI